MVGYMGDKKNMIVHNLGMMSSNCKIYQIKKEDMLYFIPDTLDQANKENFVNCDHCNESTI